MAKELTTKNEDLDTNVPSYLQGNTHVDAADNFDSNDTVIPRIKLLQGISPEVTEFEDAEVGDWWHTGTDTSLGPNFRFIIVSRNKRYLLSAPLEDGQGVLARANDAKTWDTLGSWDVKVDRKTTAKWEIKDRDVEKSGLANWGTFDPDDPESPPAATLFYDYLVYLPDNPELGMAVLSMSRTGISSAKSGINAKLDMAKQAKQPMASLMFNASSSKESAGSNQDYQKPKFRRDGWADEESFNIVKDMAIAMADVTFVPTEDREDSAPEGGSGGDSTREDI